MRNSKMQSFHALSAINWAQPKHGTRRFVQGTRLHATCTLLCTESRQSRSVP